MESSRRLAHSITSTSKNAPLKQGIERVLRAMTHPRPGPFPDLPSGSSRREWLASLLALVALSACHGKPKPKEADDEGPPPYDGQLRDLFDDEIDPAAVGLAMDGSSPANDPLLRLRCQAADIVAQLKVQTVTRDSVGAKTTFVLALQVGQPPLMPSKMEERHVELSINPEMGSFGIVQNLEASLRGKTFIGFVKRFRSDDGPVLHWHLTADNEDVAQVVHEVKVLEDLAEQESE
jgi:hypothetical protein